MVLEELFVYICNIFKLFVIVCSLFISSMVPMSWIWWCMHKIWMVASSVHILFNSSGLVGSSYVIVFAANCAIIYVSRNDSL